MQEEARKEIPENPGPIQLNQSRVLSVCNLWVEQGLNFRLCLKNSNLGGCGGAQRPHSGYSGGSLRSTPATPQG